MFLRNFQPQEVGVREGGLEPELGTLDAHLGNNHLALPELIEGEREEEDLEIHTSICHDAQDLVHDPNQASDKEGDEFLANAHFARVDLGLAICSEGGLLQWLAVHCFDILLLLHHEEWHKCRVEGHTDATTSEEGFDHVDGIKMLLLKTRQSLEGIAKPTARKITAVTAHDLWFCVVLCCVVSLWKSQFSCFLFRGEI